MEQNIVEQYGNRLRIRVSGLCWHDGKLLMINHKGLSKSGNFWAPPGGGAEFGLTMEQSLKKEFLEETGLVIEVSEFRFTTEFLNPPLHAIELFFTVNSGSRDYLIGTDPEHPEQIIKDVKYMDFNEIMALNRDERHGIFGIAPEAEKLKTLSGFWRI